MIFVILTQNHYINMEKKAKNKNHYLPPEKFHAEYNRCVENNKPSAKLIHYFELIAKRLSTKYNNVAEKDRQAIICYAVEQAWMKWDRYNKDRSHNIFSFFTTVIFNDMKSHYNTIFLKDKKRGKQLKFVSIDKLFNQQTVN